ncbi:MAG: N-acetylmuramoyl-L-alanine amidase [Burkholderiaceae bacterium]|nr:N-acetylmuramoyl-L-alanine amidase [Burkholderiaceae bacterium]
MGGIMLSIDDRGQVVSSRVRLALRSGIERGDLPVVHAVVVHQTGSSTAASTLSSYDRPGSSGAHFLIDKDGTIFQTASLYRKTHHVGQIKSRCLAERSCAPAELQALRGKRVGSGIGRVESRKEYPRRYPANSDSIGIEVVSQAPNNVFEPLTDAQQTSLQWLLTELLHTLRLARTDVYRHSEISWKQPSEASSAKW